MAGRNRLRRTAAVAVAAALVLFVLAVAFDAPVEAEPPPAGAAATERAAPPLDPVESAPVASPSGESADTVERVIDGDTIVLGSGTRVRLVQIDAPETRGSECYADQATAALAELLPAGTGVRVEADPGLDQVDRYGRQLAYVFRGDENVNATLVREGAASVWFYRGARGRYADELLAAAEDARADGRGLWGACEATLDPSAAVSTAPRSSNAAAPPPPRGEAGDACHPAYDPCLPIVADLNCPAVRALGKAPVHVRVRGDDPYRLDGDGDGVGCE